MKQHYLNLNLYYWLPIWEYRVPLLFSKMEGWIDEPYYWFSKSDDEKHITACVEPSGLCFEALMEEKEWQEWIANFKEIAQEILGFKVGEIELGEVGHEPEWLNSKLRVLEDIRLILDSNSSSEAWKYLEEVNKNELTEIEELEIDKQFFRGNWHEIHDQLASGFQWSKHPSLSEFLYEQIASNKIPEFDYKPVSRKAVWALADIGTVQSKKYLDELAIINNPVIKEFALKRITNWEKEKERKGRMIPSQLSFSKRIRLENYQDCVNRIPKNGTNIIAYQTDEHIVLYQAYKNSIARYAVENQKLGGTSFSYDRMSWLKPNYLWMMYRSGWATKENQERILAIRILKSDWELILEKAVLSNFNKNLYDNHEGWKAELNQSEVRIQWDPDHDPYGNKLDRRAIQIGIKGETLKLFGQGMIKSIEDITPFVRKQKLYVDLDDLENLELPREEIYKVSNENINIGIE
ncbi:DUF4291 domain-containing protein [Tenacibaculum ovolyticum]|uniref:DUF4291 domain-containing protein n=1 Tax=Tenacibaculum ovolyticum TaxID=104270 RepID=UPI000A5D2516|nr:DUF4291 domain-containing protein [Tenacibaculum ovolyticum]